ncbi:hypothetical protein H2199_005721 [Coniosporium tulheliwenetii]|uniref:Uncharacterized protein n=1 Tax=Coniosporium tulheliwenetii TaxID=3383036 RepID=A0ACC2Z0F3_9PEZI|nr:hypothetical protein H2199_005721 [Cladosporium sp. JES 115]
MALEATLPKRTPPSTHTRLASTAAAARALFKKNPILVSLASLSILFGAGVLLYSNYVYSSYIVGAFHKYPEPVAQKLRRALYYTNISLDPKNAVKYYRQALEVAEELGMDPFSDEIIGVKVQLAALFEKIQNYRRAIDVLEIVKGDCLRWVRERGGLEGAEAKRTRLLGKTVGINVKLGELYANEYVLDREAAEARLVEAVETVLREKQRRETEGVKPEEGEWLTDEEIGGSLEAPTLPRDPLFLQALTLSPPKSCHSVVLMNNLATSLAQQRSPSPSLSTPQPPTQQDLTHQARLWATKALSLAQTIPKEDKTEECDIGCAVATHNLAEFAEMDGEVEEARRLYGEAVKMARSVGFEEGVKTSQEALRRVGRGGEGWG